MYALTEIRGVGRRYANLGELNPSAALKGLEGMILDSFARREDLKEAMERLCEGHGQLGLGLQAMSSDEGKNVGRNTLDRRVHSCRR